MLKSKHEDMMKCLNYCGSAMGALKMQEVKMMDRVAGHEIARHENVEPSSMAGNCRT